MQIDQQKCVNCRFLVEGKCQIHEHEISVSDSFYEWCADWTGEIKTDDRLRDDSEGTWL